MHSRHRLTSLLALCTVLALAAPGAAVRGDAFSEASALAQASSYRDMKLREIERVTSDMALRAQGPRSSPAKLRANDPGRGLTSVTRPRLIFFRAPCPVDVATCERQAPPLPGDGKTFRVTNYYVGMDGDVAIAIYAGAFIDSGQGFIRVDGLTSSTYLLPLERGTPILESVREGRASFATTAGDLGFFDLAARTFTFSR